MADEQDKKNISPGGLTAIAVDAIKKIFTDAPPSPALPAMEEGLVKEVLGEGTSVESVNQKVSGDATNGNAEDVANLV